MLTLEDCQVKGTCELNNFYEFCNSALNLKLFIKQIMKNNVKGLDI